MVNNDLLIHELQLGESLNECVHSDRRADFSLMLAMLVEDAQEFSQFKTPVTHQHEQKSSEEQLRRQFELPKQHQLSIVELSEINQFNQSSKANALQMSSINLEDAISPKPLSFRDDKQFIPTDVKSNTTLYCQQKIDASEELAVKRMQFNANEWLKSVKNTRTKSVIAAA